MKYTSFYFLDSSIDHKLGLSQRHFLPTWFTVCKFVPGYHYDTYNRNIAVALNIIPPNNN